MSTQSSLQQLRSWVKQTGCLIHPAIEIPAWFEGVQGIGTKQDLPHKTIIMAIPSKLVITVPRCYDDPELKSLYRMSDELFDYQVDQDAEFNILCVFLMYHKMHMERSPWRAYLSTIAEPETAVSWPDRDLAGLNKSIIEEVLHVRKQCKKVQHNLCEFLTTTKQFQHLNLQQITALFRVCYPTVLTRCFGYYFSSACMIPIADLMNHGCETIDHQLVHLDFEQGLQFDETYHPRQHKINCELMGLSRPHSQSMPFRLDYLIRNGLVEDDPRVLGALRRADIDAMIYRHLGENVQRWEECQIEKLDFCEEDDEQDNDTDEEEEYGQLKSLEQIRAAEKEQMEEFGKYYLRVEKMGEVERRIRESEGNEKVEGNEMKKDENAQQEQEKIETSPKQSTAQSIQTPTTETQSPSTNKITQDTPNTTKSSIPAITFPPQHKQQVQVLSDSSSTSSASQQQQWCLDQCCYFTMSTHAPVRAGSQLFNSYGSRTNKFLLVWYGFAYPDNLYDSVTLRVQASFPEVRPKARDVVLDTYVGGQGLCFKKNDNEEVRPEEVSREFRLKRSKLPLQLMMFLRLVLVNYYEGEDNYKILCTVPSSLEFELQLLLFVRDIVMELYNRYPVHIIEALRQQQAKQTDCSRKSRIHFKVVYLQQQRKILDSNMQALDAAIQVVRRLKSAGQFVKTVYADYKIETIRKIRQYLVDLKTHFNYIMYCQKSRFATQTETQEQRR